MQSYQDRDREWERLRWFTHDQNNQLRSIKEDCERTVATLRLKVEGKELFFAN